MTDDITTPVKCECRNDGTLDCPCRLQPRYASMLVERDGKRINVCDWCDMSSDVHIDQQLTDDVTASASPPAERLLLVALTADEIRLVAAALSVQTQFAVIAPGLADTARVEKMQDVRARLMARLTREG